MAADRVPYEPISWRHGAPLTPEGSRALKPALDAAPATAGNGRP